MTNTLSCPNSVKRALLPVIAWLAMALSGCNPASGKQLKDAEMNQLPATLWQTIDTLAKQIPFKRAKIERVFETKLFVGDPREFVIQPSFESLEGGPVGLADGVVVEMIDLRVGPEDSDPGFLVLRVAGTCINLDEVRARYGTLAITDHPRGRSLDEVTAFTSNEPWGKLSFGFAVRNPDCLSGVAFAPKGLKEVTSRF